MIVLNIFSTYKYCQISQAGNSTLELGPNREVNVDLSSPKQSRYIVLSDGALRVMFSIVLSAKKHLFIARELSRNFLTILTRTIDHAMMQYKQLIVCSIHEHVFEITEPWNSTLRITNQRISMHQCIIHSQIVY
jgi:hypothetical protein